MWDPTHVQVTVQRAKGLVIKGKNGTNNCFVTIALGKEKFQTSVKHKAPENVEWLEECELRIPSQGNVAEIVLKVLDQDKIKDHLLGQVSIPLKDLDPYERPRNRWYPLLGKPGKETKNRGELEVKIAFIVKEGSLTDLSKIEKHRSSLSSLAHNLGGSLMSIGTIEKRRGIKNFAKNLGSKMNLNKKDKKSDSSSLSGSFGNLKSSNLSTPDLHSTPKKVRGEADPGIISEDEDEFAFDDLSHKSSGSSLNVQTLPRGNKYTPSPVNASLENLGGGEFLRRSTISHLTNTEKSAPSKPVRLSLVNFTPPQVPANVMVDKDDEWSQKLHSKSKSNNQSTIEREKSSSLERNKKLDSPSSLKEKPSPKFFKKFGNSKPKKLLEERIIVGEENIVEEDTSAYGSIPHTVVQQLQGKSREDLVLMIYNLQKDVESEKKKNKDLENYLDDLLLRVMETTPRILQNPYARNNSMYIKNK